MEKCEERFQFDERGYIFCAKNDKDAEETIKVLNLNNAILNNKRKAAIAGIIWCKEENQDIIKGELSKISSKQNIMFPFAL